MGTRNNNAGNYSRLKGTPQRLHRRDLKCGPLAHRRTKGFSGDLVREVPNYATWNQHRTQVRPRQKKGFAAGNPHRGRGERKVSDPGGEKVISSLIFIQSTRAFSLFLHGEESIRERKQGCALLLTHRRGGLGEKERPTLLKKGGGGSWSKG